LIYTLEQGPHERRIIEQCMRYEQEIPDAIKNAPELAIGLGMYYEAFHDLSSSRVGNAIPWREVNHYCKEKGYSEEQQDTMHYVIASLDEARAVFIKMRNKGSETD